MRRLEVEELKEGMILAEDILGNHDIIYATSGTILSESIIEGLKNLDMKFIYIIDKYDDDNKPIIVDKSLQKSYSKTINRFKDIYFNVKVGKRIVVDEIEASTKPLIDEVLKSNNILGKLRQIQVNDDYTYRHSINVCLISTMIGKWLGLKQEDLNRLAIAGLLHDIGKSKIPSAILNKPDKLTDEEFKIMKTHTTLGYRIIKETKDISIDIQCGVLQHHERIDGKGYPLGLGENKIHMFAKIIAVADVYDAMTSERVYKHKESPFKVAELIFENSFGHLDAEIANTFLKKISQFYVGNIIRLNTGEIAEIVLINNSAPTRPLIRIEDKFVDLSKDYFYEIIDIIN